MVLVIINWQLLSATHGKCWSQVYSFLKSSENGPTLILNPMKEWKRWAPFCGNALTIADLPHILAILDAVDHFREAFFLLLNSSCGFSLSFHPEPQLLQALQQAAEAPSLAFSLIFAWAIWASWAGRPRGHWSLGRPDFHMNLERECCSFIFWLAKSNPYRVS